METIILVSPQIEKWQEFGDTLQANDRFNIVKARSAAEAVKAARTVEPLAVAVDADLGDQPGVELVRQLIAMNAMIHTALASNAPEEQFHQQTEGLGILMKLSSTPNSAEAGRFAESLRQVAVPLHRNPKV